MQINGLPHYLRNTVISRPVAIDCVCACGTHVFVDAELERRPPRPVPRLQQPPLLRVRLTQEAQHVPPPRRDGQVRGVGARNGRGEEVGPPIHERRQAPQVPRLAGHVQRGVALCVDSS